MERPCKCDKSECRKCHLFHNDERYRKLWSPPEPPAPKPRAIFPNGKVLAALAKLRANKTPAPPHTPEPEHVPANPSVGVVISTFGTPAYVALHLENRKRHYPDVPALVVDDASACAPQLQELCAKYGAEFHSNSERLGHYHGDLSAFVTGLRWGARVGVDLLVKMSRTWLVCKPWVSDFKALAVRTQYPTYSNRCDHYRFGFRSECVGLLVDGWSGMLGEIAGTITRRDCSHVEAFLDQLAQRIPLCEVARRTPTEHPGHASWDLLGTNRHHRPEGILWHDNTPTGEYHLLSRSYGLSYTSNDFSRDEPQPRVTAPPKRRVVRATPERKLTERTVTERKPCNCRKDTNG